MNNSESNGNTQNNEDVMYETNRIKCDQGKRNQLQLQFRFLRPRRPSEEQSDSEDKLFIPVPYHGVRPNFVSNASKPFTTKAEFEEIPLSKKVMDLNFINIPLTPDNEVAQESLPKSAGQISSEVQSSHYKREEIFCESRQTTAHAQIPVKDQVSRHLRTLSAPPAFDYEEKPDEKRSFQHTFDSAFDHGCHLERFDSEKSRSFSIVDSLLFEIYDKRNFGRRLSGDSDACTEYSTMSEGGLFNKSNSATFSSCNPPASVGNISMVAGRSKFKRAFLENKGNFFILLVHLYATCFIID